MENIKFSKSLLDIVEIKSDFTDENHKYFQEALKINEVYSSQPKRTICKICKSDLIKKEVDIISHNVEYKICENCGHLNGNNQENKDFFRYLYVENDGMNNPNRYSTDYEMRINNIYKPKAEFLIDELKRDNCTNYTISDFGCGGGHFVNVLNLLGIYANGYDIAANSIELAKEASGKLLKSIQNKKVSNLFHKLEDESDLASRLLHTNSKVVSFLGVLEHVENPINIIETFMKSDASYIFFSVPLLSLTIFIENVFKNSFPRHLSSDHTHLFSHKSIEYIFKKYGLKSVAKWHFGIDSMDLRRSMITELLFNKTSQKGIELFQKEYFSKEIMNLFQEIIDQKFAGSEVHILAKKC